MYKDYFLRATENDWHTLCQLGVMLGVIAQAEDSNTFYGINGCEWDYIGTIQLPTGELLEDEFGNEFQKTSPATSPDGALYIHANLRCSFDLKEAALASGQETILQAMQELSKYFVTDENGIPQTTYKSSKGVGITIFRRENETNKIP